MRTYRGQRATLRWATPRLFNVTTEGLTRTFTKKRDIILEFGPYTRPLSRMLELASKHALNSCEEREYFEALESNEVITLMDDAVREHEQGQCMHERALLRPTRNPCPGQVFLRKYRD